jgi:hypothetical protein
MNISTAVELAKPKPIDPSLQALDRSISIARWVVVGWMVVTAAFYALWMLKWGGWTDTASPGKGGTLGDFFGGVLNPVISLAAFYWLTKAVRLQKEELADTKRALEDSSSSQALSVQIAALSALIESHTADIGNRRDHLAFLMNQRGLRPGSKVYSMRGTVLSEDKLQKLLSDLNAGIRDRSLERKAWILELHEILNRSRENSDITEFRDTFSFDDDVVTFDDSPGPPANT